MVKSKYLPSNGTASDVDGIISEMSKKNIVWESRIEMHSATWLKIMHKI
jgi:hypothetical protein